MKSIRIAMSVTCLLTALNISACSANPSERDARKVYEYRNSHDLKKGEIEIVSFKKVNGKSMDVYGQKFYTLEYEVVIKYPKGINPQCATGNTAYTPCGLLKVRAPGQLEKLTGEVDFEKTERGWKGDDGRL